MLRKLGAIIAATIVAGTLFGPTAAAQPVRNTLPGVGNDMTCDLRAPVRIKTVDGFALQIAQEPANKGKVIQTWVWGGNEQKWVPCKTAGSDPNAFYTFWNIHTKNCLGVWGQMPGDGAYFTETECVAGGHHRFARIVDAPTGLFLLQVVHSGKFMNVLNNNNGANTIMAQYSDMGKLFYLERA